VALHQATKDRNQEATLSFLLELEGQNRKEIHPSCESAGPELSTEPSYLPFLANQANQANLADLANLANLANLADLANQVDSKHLELLDREKCSGVINMYCTV